LKEFGMIWVIYSVALVVINDTMAYFFGITLGKHPLLSTISPKKTWEGFLGAAVTTMAVAYYWLPDKQDAIALASVIKRAYEQKDFGALFPGHGGLVDRLDCQLVLAPFVYLYLLWKTSN
jgi:phosphatidate cytidylyltransferase